MKDNSANGLWSVTFSSHILEFNGVLILENGRAMGGDSNFVYSGRYKKLNEKFIIRVRVKKYNMYLKTMMPAEYTLSLAGELNNNKLVLSGSPDANKELEINVVGIKQADLPRVQELAKG